RFHLRGLRISGAHDIGWIRDITVKKLMQEGAQAVLATTPLTELRQQIPAGRAKRVFVHDESRHYCGIIDVANLHSPDIDKDIETMTAASIAKGRDAYLLPGQNIQQALERFAAFRLEELPVLASETDSTMIGYVSESYALRRYAQELEQRNLALSDSATPVAD